MNAELVDRAFEALARTLASYRLPCDSGYRQADPSEFMLMNVCGLEYAFKHRCTRNYLYVTISPATYQPRWTDCHGNSSDFHRGDFTPSTTICCVCGDFIDDYQPGYLTCKDCSAAEPSPFAGMGYLDGCDEG